MGSRRLSEVDAVNRQPQGSLQHELWQALGLLATDFDDIEAVLPLMESVPELTVESCIAQGLGPAASRGLTSSGLVVPGPLRQEAEAARFAREVSVDVLTQVDNALEAANIPWVALKGAVVGSFYTEPNLRIFHDIDILVRGSDLGASLDALIEVGIEDINRNWANYLLHGVAETPLWAMGMPIDLHWHLIAMAGLRRGTAVDVEAMIERRRRITIADAQVWAFSREDLLIHVCLHAALSGGTKLRWLIDVRELIRSESPDWDEVVRRARAVGTAAKIGQILDRARCLVQADVPVEVAASLCPRPLLLTRRWIDGKERGLGLPDRYVRGMPVEVTGDSTRPIVGGGWRVVRRRFGPKRVWNVGDPNGPLYWDHPSGGSDGRSAYIRYAASSVVGSQPDDNSRQEFSCSKLPPQSET